MHQKHFGLSRRAFASLLPFKNASPRLILRLLQSSNLRAIHDRVLFIREDIIQHYTHALAPSFIVNNPKPDENRYIERERKKTRERRKVELFFVSFQFHHLPLKLCFFFSRSEKSIESNDISMTRKCHTCTHTKYCVEKKKAPQKKS